MVLSLAALTAACGTPEEEPTAPATDPELTTEDGTPEPAADDGFEAQWQDLIAKAQEEGELVIVPGGSESKSMPPAWEIFEEEFGIDVVYSAGSGSQNTDRLLAERQRGVYEADIFAAGSGSTPRMVEAGALEPIEPLIIHPEFHDRSGWRIEEVFYSDPEEQYTIATDVRYRRNYDSIFYNTDNVSAEEVENLQSWDNLLSPEWQGRAVSVLDPNADGITTCVTLVYLFVGPEWIENFVKNADSTLLPQDQVTEMADGVAAGSWDIAVINPADDEFIEAVELGLPVAEFPHTLEEGTAVEIRGNVGAMIDQAPHPNAAQLYINWMLSQEGQTADQLHSANHDGTSASLRNDIPQGQVSDEMWETLQQEDLHYVAQAGPDWFAKTDEAFAFLEELIAEVGAYGY